MSGLSCCERVPGDPGRKSDGSRLLEGSGEWDCGLVFSILQRPLSDLQSQRSKLGLANWIHCCRGRLFSREQALTVSCVPRTVVSTDVALGAFFV